MQPIHFSRGSGSYSTEIETIGSTRNSIITFYNVTYSGRISAANGTTGNCSWTCSNSVSISVSYPALTSGTVQPGGGGTHTTWGLGYSVWGPAAVSTTNSGTVCTSANTTFAVVSTHPATTEWASMKVLPLNWATSFPAGDYWLGILRTTSTGSSSTSQSSITTFAVAGSTASSMAITYQASNMTQTALATLAPNPGHGSFSATYSPLSTYVNNATVTNPVGAIAFSQINTNVSFFSTWMMFANNRI